MLGGSAIRMAQLIKEQELSASVICVDPFTGDVNMWAWEQELTHRNQWRFLRLEKGRPTIYDRFLANCVAAHCNDIILPINTTSTVGMKLLKRLYSERRINELPNYRYLDSAHEPRETLLELHLAWDLLVDGGILFGDDWSWDSVRHDVLQFASEAIDTIDLRFAEQIAAKLPGSVLQDGILLYEGQWVMRKTSA